MKSTCTYTYTWVNNDNNTITELEITAGHWPFYEKTADLTGHFTKFEAIVAYQATR